MPEFLASIVPGFALDIWNWFPPLWQYLFTVLFKILVLTIGVILVVAFSTYFERKVIGSMQARGSVGTGAAFCRCHQAPDQRSHCAVEVEQVPVRYCTAADTNTGLGDLGGHSNE
jgi:hypothetical protein